jgi:Fe-S cluster assembly protein SufD
VSVFTADAARALPGPDWLRARRAAAAEAFAGSALPTADEEVWRYSRIGDLDLDAYHLGGGSSGDAMPAEARAALDRVPARAAAVVVCDGRVVHGEVADGWEAKGLTAGPVGDRADGDGLLGAVLGEPPDVFSVLNDAFALDPVAVRVPAGMTVDDPIVVVHWTSEEGLAVFPRLAVQLGADSQATVLDVALSASGARAFSAPVTELDVGPAARLGYLAVQDLGLDTWQIGSQVSRVGADGTLVSATAGLGGDYARQRTDCRLSGRGSTGNLLAVYFGEGDQTLDFRTFQDHAAPDTTSNLLFKGAVGGRSRSVYTGLIRVRKEGRGTNAFQTNRNIKLSEHAWAESVPNLEIENNDVKCSHASAVGPIDEDQLFYLESRGVPPEQAERLVVAGFFDEVIQQVPVRAMIPMLRAAVAGKLSRRES